MLITHFRVETNSVVAEVVEALASAKSALSLQRTSKILSQLSYKFSAEESANLND